MPRVEDLFNDDETSSVTHSLPVASYDGSESDGEDVFRNDEEDDYAADDTLPPSSECEYDDDDSQDEATAHRKRRASSTANDQGDKTRSVDSDDAGSQGDMSQPEVDAADVEESDSAAHRGTQARRAKRGRVSDGTTHTQPVTKATKITPGAVKNAKERAPDGRACRKDFDTESRDVINLACNIYETLLITENAFPDSATESRFVKTAWDEACRTNEVELVITSDVRKMVSTFVLCSTNTDYPISQLTRLGSHLRSEAKRDIRPLVAAAFQPGHSSKSTATNIALAAQLKTDQAFIMPVCVHHSMFTSISDGGGCFISFLNSRNRARSA